jgi:hypothetical protein
MVLPWLGRCGTAASPRRVARLYLLHAMAEEGHGIDAVIIDAVERFGCCLLLNV